ncbi:hypothetical protein J6N69_04335 [bacterium]|nr:hypothetical protein [bacterium]
MIDYSTLLFFLRNGKRAQEGEGGRGFVAIGQGAKVVKQICDYDNIFSRGTKSAVKAFKTVAENDKIFNGISKGVKFASENVNPLIVVSSGINVLTSKDKQSTIIAEAGNLAGMFAVEGWMKKHLDDVLKNLPINQKWIPIVRGIAFVIGSIGASTLCYNIGKVFASELKTINEKSQLEQNQQHEQIVKLFQDKNQSNNLASKSLAYSA